MTVILTAVQNAGFHRLCRRLAWVWGGQANA